MEPLRRPMTIVIPVGPGDSVAPALRQQLLQRCGDAEVIVVKALESVSDASLTRAPDWTTVAAPAGRARQQNAGARLAKGQYLWFLHADSQLADTSLEAVSRFIGCGTRALGYLDLRFLPDGPARMRLNAWGANLRSRWLGMPFGDQGFLIHRADFEALGGFDERLAVGEDHDLVWRARRAGLPLRPLGAPLLTSARKYSERGWRRTTWHHLRASVEQALRFSRPSAGR